MRVGTARVPSWSGVAVVVAAGVAVLPLPVSVPLLLGCAAVFATLTVLALLTRAAPAVRAMLFLGAVFLIFDLAEIGSWPPVVTAVLVCAVPLAVLLACNRVQWLRPAAPWLRPGRPTRGMVVLGAAAVVGAAVALTVWALVFHPEPSPYLRSLHGFPTWLAVAGVVGFALVNPIWEEALFRGVLLGEIGAVWGTRVAVVTQAVVFGAAHWAGFPSGWLGVVGAGGWGLALGVIRVRTGGILSSYVVHVCVNATIGLLALVLL